MNAAGRSGDGAFGQVLLRKLQRAGIDVRHDCRRLQIGDKLLAQGLLLLALRGAIPGTAQQLLAIDLVGEPDRLELSSLLLPMEYTN